MELKNYNVYFFFVILIGVTILAWFVLQPFAIPFLIAAILAHLFYFLYEAILKVFKSGTFSSLLTCLIIALVVIIPVVFISALVVNEIQSMLMQISIQPSQGGNLIMSTIVKIQKNLSETIFFIPSDFMDKNLLLSSLRLISQNALTIFGSIYANVAHFFFVTFIMFFSLFYLFIDGKKLIRKVMQLSPIKNSYENLLLERFNSITRATIKGTTLVAIVQGLIGGILFFFTDVPAPVLLGMIMVLTSVIPAVGSGLVWAPVGIAMILAGQINQGIIILLVGALIISMIDNFIKPALVGRDTQMHPLLILFATLGGITFFGIIGFIIGPIILSLFIALWDIYQIEFKKQLKEFNG
jgi:predicted PurR-regulated permease PerM